MSETFAAESAGGGAQDTIIEVRDIEVTYNMSRGRARVLDDVSVDIHRGETFGIVGESGCGKSMFASSLLAAVEDPGVTTGEVIYHPEEGEPVNILDLSRQELNLIRWEEIAMVYQGAMTAFNPTLSVRAHFEETFEAHDVEKEEGLERARDIIRDLNLEPERILDSYAHEMSGGEKQRTLLALSLVFNPEVLILDEPTAAVDILMQRGVLGLLFELKDEYDLTLLFISHDIPVVSGFADRLAVMYAFEFVEFGEANEVLLNPEHPYTRMLLRTTLSLDTPLDRVKTIEGTTPDPINVPTGCSFHPRCPISDDRCEVEDPQLRSEIDQGDTHEVACFYPDLATDRIPVSIAEEDEEEEQ